MAVTASKEVMEKAASFPEVEKVLPNEKRQLTQRQSKAPFQMKKKQKEIKAKEGIEWNISQIDAPQARYQDTTEPGRLSPPLIREFSGIIPRLRKNTGVTILKIPQRRIMK